MLVSHPRAPERGRPVEFRSYRIVDGEVTEEPVEAWPYLTERP